jgi:hypothetical protein
VGSPYGYRGDSLEESGNGLTYRSILKDQCACKGCSETEPLITFCGTLSTCSSVSTLPLSASGESITVLGTFLATKIASRAPPRATLSSFVHTIWNDLCVISYRIMDMTGTRRSAGNGAHI